LSEKVLFIIYRGEFLNLDFGIWSFNLKILPPGSHLLFGKIPLWGNYCFLVLNKGDLSFTNLVFSSQSMGESLSLVNESIPFPQGIMIGP